MKRYLVWMVLILLAAAALRLVALPDLPPGLTHDEADHGLSAWGVVNGVRPLYFTVGYGREPLYDYLTAGLMTILGPSYLAGRLISVYLSLFLIAGMATWTRLAWGRTTALWTAAGLAGGFWPLMTARQGLRTLLQPTLFVLAAAWYWRRVRYATAMRSIPDQSPSFIHQLLPFLPPAVWLGLSFYAYIPARIIWLVFPVWLVVLWLRQRVVARQLVGGTVGMLLIAAAIGLPLFRYLYTHPTAETRIGQLSGPLTQAFQGEWAALGANVVGALRLFTFAGDTAWRYNLPGKPWLDPGMGWLFYAGLLLTLWLGLKRPTAHASFFALAWLVLGLLPSLITGPMLSTTQAIALQPVLYLFPAMVLTQGVAVAQKWRHQNPQLGLRVGVFMAVMLWGLMAFYTGHDYFDTWANHPEVRVQYETTLVETIDWVNTRGRVQVAISTTTPGAFHSPAVAQMTLTNPEAGLRWFNGQGALLIPAAGPALVTFSGFAPLNPLLADYLSPAMLVATLPLRETDKDRPVWVYEVDPRQIQAQWQGQFELAEATWGNSVRLLGYALLTPQRRPGETAQLVTWWQVLHSDEEMVFFSHLVGRDGIPMAQADRLDVPAPTWVAGDQFLQLHELPVAGTVAAATYSLVIGAYYNQPGGPRLPVVSNGAAAGDTFPLTTITIVP